jgi:hypothetical protein
LFANLPYCRRHYNLTSDAIASRVLSLRYVAAFRQRNRHGADDAGVDEGECEEHPGHVPGIFAKPGRDRASALEVALLRAATECLSSEGHHRHCADQDQHDADPKVGPLIAHEAGRDPLVDDVALLEEKLPGRDCRRSP